VDIPSQSGHEAAVRDRVLGLVPSDWAAEHAGDEAFLYLSRRRAGFPLVVLPRTTTRFRRRGISRAGSRTATCTASVPAT
jgi:hypothetical protein